MNTKIIILSAPSGSGKSTIASEIFRDPALQCSFSVSATSRPPRSHEKHGEHYFFLTTARFKKYIREDKFVEWEEVYPGQYYGTLRSEIERLSSLGKNIIFDVDVKGGVRLKQIFGTQALSLFIKPPTFDELKNRLKKRNTESEESIKKRLDRAVEELKFEDQFDIVIVNDDLEKAIATAKKHIISFTGIRL